MEWFSTWWSALPEFERIFWFLAIPSSVLLILQLILTVVGLDGADGDTDVDFDGDMDTDFDGDTGAFDDFPILSVRNFIAFFVMTGWVGIAMTRSGASNFLTILVALFAGLTSMVVMTILFKLLMGLASSGNVSIKDAIGKNGEVYMPIPGNMKDFGKINITVAEKMLECKAVTKGESIETGTAIKVVDIINNKLVVERV